MEKYFSNFTERRELQCYEHTDLELVLPSCTPCKSLNETKKVQQHETLESVWVATLQKLIHSKLRFRKTSDSLTFCSKFI